MIWCSNPTCSMAIEQPQGAKLKKVTCGGCSAESCFRCQTSWHEGRPCRKTKFKKSSALTIPLYFANVRKCPRCSTFVSKSQGCLHVLCTKCRLAFCWSCMGALSQHSKCHRLCPELPFGMATNIGVSILFLMNIPLITSIGPLLWFLYIGVVQGAKSAYSYLTRTKKWHGACAALLTFIMSLFLTLPAALILAAICAVIFTIFGALPLAFWTVSYLLRILYHYLRLILCA